MEKKPNTSNSNNSEGGFIIIKCKDFRIIQLDIKTTKELLNVYTSIERLSNLDNPERLYPFFYRPMYTILEDGHTLFKPETEFAKLLASDEWRLSSVNKDYSICSTYSAALIVPKTIEDDVLIAAANFREGGRFPLLSFRHENGSVLMRSGQPLLNNTNRRCRSDEKILNAILGPNKKGYIVDTRSSSYASQCKAKGGGTEPDGHYTQWKRIHKGLDKIANCNGHLLESLSKLIEGVFFCEDLLPLPSLISRSILTHLSKFLGDFLSHIFLFCVACNDVGCSSDKWLSRLESSNWLTHVQTSLNAACLVAQCLDQEGVSVLVHGTAGLDSTLLITSVAQVILNPDCRTVRGKQKNCKFLQS